MKRDSIIKSLTLGALFVFVGYMLISYYMDSQAQADSPNGTAWVCTNQECGYGFNKSIDELGAFYREHPNGQITCPKCKAPAVRAFQCPECGKVFAGPKGGGAPLCPSCGYDVRIGRLK